MFDKMRGVVRCACLCVALLWLLAGCVRNEVGVDFALAPDVNSTYSLTYYASDKEKGWIVENIVAVQQGKSLTKCLTVNPTLVYLRSTGAGGNALPVVFYARRGDKITIKGKGPDPAEWEIGGNEITDLMTKWRVSAAKIFALMRTDPAAARRQLDERIVEFIIKNKDNPASALLLLVYFDRRNDPANFDRCMSMLKGDAADPEWQRLVSRADMTGPVAQAGGMPERILLKTAEKGCDTIVPGRVPAMLYFTRNSVPDYDSDMAVLRGLSRDFADSSLRVIADINIEPDSATRGYKLRTDSLRGAVRAWMPLGLSDEVAVRLGVRRVPYFIVIDGRKRVVYRGDDTKKAEDEFRKLIKKL